MRTDIDFDVRPRVAIWELTRACDLACVHCRASAMPDADPAQLSPDEGLRLLDQMVALDPEVLVLTGGDPLKRPDVYALVEAAVARGLTVAVAPSVTPLLTREAIDRLARAGVHRIALSIDGPNAVWHDAFRGAPGSFAATVRAAAAVRLAGVPLQINSSVTPDSLARLRPLGSLVGALRPTLWSVFFVVPTGRAKGTPPFDPARCEAAFHWLYGWSRREDVPVKTTAAPAYRRVALERTAWDRHLGAERGAPPMRAGVNDGKGFVFVSHVGDVSPSGFLPLVVGNVRETPLATLYRDHPLFRALRDPARLEGKCGVCPFRVPCGGSRARAWATSGNAFAADPACAYEPRAVRTRSHASAMLDRS